MKKYLQNGWMRVLSSIVCAVSIISLAIGALGFVFVTAFRDSHGIYESGYNMVAENYALYAIDMLEQGEEEKLQKEFAEKGINCSIQLMLNIPDASGEVISTVEKQVIVGEIDEEHKIELEAVAGSNVRYRENSLLGVLLGYCGYSDEDDWVEYPIEKVVFNPTTGLFYYQTPIGYYKIDEVDVYTDNVYFDYVLTQKDGQEYYYNGYYQIKLDPSTAEEWTKVRIDGNLMGLTTVKEQSEVYEVHGWLEGDVWIITQPEDFWAEDIRTTDFSVAGAEIYAPAPELPDMYQVQISWSNSDNESLFTEWKHLSDLLNAFDTMAVPMIFISFIFMVLSFGLMICSANNEKEKLSFMQKTPVACYTFAVYMVMFCICAIVWEGGNWLIGSDIGRLSDIITLGGLVAFVLVWIALGWLLNIVSRIKCKSFWRTSEIYYGYVLLKKSWKFISNPLKACWTIVTKPFRAVGRVCKDFMQQASKNTTLFAGGIIVFIVLALIDFYIIAQAMWYGSDYFFLFIFVKGIELLAVVIILFHMQQLHEGSKRVASGDMSKPIDTQRMFWKFKEHGENINKVSDGIALAVNERMKSEHFKTELITNVSHDIKTPLTSIINYVDLIKKEDVQDEKVQGYVEVLDRQSARLKKLIEDLMEASKASTGNLAVNLEECDIEVLLTQVIGEFEEKLSKNQLEVVVEKPEHPVKMMADGRHMWRVLDNLLNNACKYSMPGTRVYVSLKEEDNTAVVVFKNISKTALNIPSDELMERFVRGDSSRNTEGSGLGLSIAQSLTELMHGSMKLEIDGDLFKVTLRFPMM